MRKRLLKNESLKVTATQISVLQRLSTEVFLALVLTVDLLCHAIDGQAIQHCQSKAPVS